MTRALIILAALLGAAAYVQTDRLGRASASLARAQDDLTAARNAARVLGSYYTTLQAERDRWTAIEAGLDDMEGADAPLSDYGRSVLDRVRTP